MLQVTKKVEYGLIALAYITTGAGRPVSAREVAERNFIPVSLTANVLKALAKAGVVATQRGSAGGYTLDRDPLSISLQEVLEAVEGPVRLASCCTDDGLSGCDLVGACSIKASVTALNARLARAVADMSLGEFLQLGIRERNTWL